MKILIIILFLIFTSIFAFAEDDEDFDSGYLQQDFLYKDRVNIYDEDGSKSGYMKKDFLFDRVNIYDEKGKQTGYIEKDFLYKDRVNIKK